MTDDRSTIDDGLFQIPLRLCISLFAVLGYALAFGAAVAAVGHLLGLAKAATGTETVVALRVVGGGALLIPPAAFLFLALYVDTDLTRPGWPGRHPPLVDAWLFAVGAAGVVAVALTRPDALLALWTLGWLAVGAVAYLALPLWLGRRCLRRPSWTLGVLAAVLALGVQAGGAVATVALPIKQPVVAIAVALVGTAVPYALAYASPGPDRLEIRTVEMLGRTEKALGRTLR